MARRLTTAAERSAPRSSADARHGSSEMCPVVITLSPTQVAGVLRSASGSVLAALLSEHTDMRDIASRIDVRQMSGSLFNGLLILTRLPADGSLMRNAELALTLGMSQTTVHRYLQTLVAVGLVEHDAATRKYRRVA